MARTYRRKNSVIHADYVADGLDMRSPEARAHVARLHRDGAWQADRGHLQEVYNRQFRSQQRQAVYHFLAADNLLEDSPLLPKLIHKVPDYYW